MTITTRLFTFFHGQYVGRDQFGNRYYRERNKPKDRREKRWVRYAYGSLIGDFFGWGTPDPSRVPPQWHGWMHYTTDVPPSKSAPAQHEWQQPYQPNMTGTMGAYVPPGHAMRGGQRAASTADYEPWVP